MELRRSAAPLVALAGAVLFGLLLWIRRDEWENGWTGLALTLRNDLTVLVPLALAAGAWQGGRERRARTEELLTTTPRPAWRRVLSPAAAVLLGMLCAVAVPLAVAGALHGPGQWLHQAWPAAVVWAGLLAAAAAVLLGVGLGRAVRSNLAAPLSLVVLFVVLLAFQAASYRKSWALLLTPSIEPSGSDLDQVRTAATGGQVVWFAALLLAGVVLAVAGRWPARVLAAVPVVAGLAAAVPLLAADGGTAYAVDPVAARPVCADGGPQVCVAAVHARVLPDATAAARQVLATLRRLPGAPTRAAEDPSADDLDPTPADALAADVLALTPSDLTAPHAGADELAGRFADGLGVPMCRSDPPGGYERLILARTVTGAWLLDRPRTAIDFRGAEQALQRLRALPPAEQIRRVTAARAVFRSCTGDALAALS